MTVMCEDVHSFSLGAVSCTLAAGHSGMHFGFPKILLDVDAALAQVFVNGIFWPQQLDGV